MILYDIENLNSFELTQEYISHECRMMDKEDVYKWVYEDEKQIENDKKEIERLNNIIKNLDKMFEYYFIGNKKYDENTVNTIYVKYIKLKELKESGNNEG